MSESKYYDVLPTRIRMLIEEKGITQNMLASEIGVSRQAISQYSDGSSTPNADKLLKIANYFKVSPNYLLGYKETETSEEFLIKMMDYTGLDAAALKGLHKYRESAIERYVISFLLNNNDFLEKISRYMIVNLYKDFVEDEQYKYFPKLGTYKEYKHQAYDILDELHEVRNYFTDSIRLKKSHKDEIIAELYEKEIDWKYCLEIYTGVLDQSIIKLIETTLNKKSEDDYMKMIEAVNRFYDGDEYDLELAFEESYGKLKELGLTNLDDDEVDKLNDEELRAMGLNENDIKVLREID